MSPNSSIASALLALILAFQVVESRDSDFNMVDVSTSSDSIILEKCFVGGECGDGEVCGISNSLRVLEKDESCPTGSECICVSNIHQDGSWGSWEADVSNAVVLSSTYCEGNAGLPEGYITSCTSSDGKAAVGDECVVTCPKNYKGSHKVWKCHSNGKFNGTMPSCDRTRCKTPQEVKGMDTAACRDIYPGASCNITCREGYSGGYETMSCSDDGVIAMPTLVCEHKFCDVPELVIASGFKHNCDRKAHGSSCLVSCGDRFDMKGQPSRLTCIDGTFRSPSQGDFSLPKCAEAAAGSCKRNFPRGLGLASSRCAGTPIGGTCALQCDDGFEAEKGREKANIVTCNADGSFTDTNYSCVPKRCPDLSTIPGFASEVIKHSCRDLAYGQSCAVKCADGFELAPESEWLTLKCGEDGEYRAFGKHDVLVPPTCKAQECNVEQLYGHGINVRGCVATVAGDECKVLPEEGYELEVGFVDFAGEVNLGGYRSLRDAMRSHEFTFVREKLPEGAKFVCSSSGTSMRFKYLGPRSATFVDVKAVKGKCATPELPEGADLYCASNERCFAYCESGYEGVPRMYECGEGNMTVPKGQVVSCVATSRRRLQTPSGTNGDCFDAVVDLLAGSSTGKYATSCYNTSANENCGVGCGSGFNGTGGSEFALYMCQSDGSLMSVTSSEAYLNMTLPSCEALACSEGLPSGQAVVHNCDGKVTFENCTASCAPGYQGSAETYTCGTSGSFDGFPMNCAAAPCDAFAPGAQYAVDQCDGLRTGESCPVFCAAGYTRQGDIAAVFTCAATGELTGTLPTCVPNACTSGVPVDASLYVEAACNNLVTGQECTVRCAAGFAGNSSTYTCLPQGQVSGVMPSCTAQTCGVMPQLGEGVQITCTSMPVAYLETCHLTCMDGYTNGGDRSSETWTCNVSESDAGVVELRGQSLYCEATPCSGGLPSGESYEHNCDGVSTGGECNIHCAAGYSSDSSFVTGRCEASGFLSWPVVACKKSNCSALTGNAVFGQVCGGKVFGEKCLVTCPSGYDYVAGSNASELFCDVDATSVTGVSWTGSLPSCVPRTCDTSPTSQIMSERYGTNCNNTPAGESCSVWCSPANYVPGPGESNISQVLCSASFQFEGRLPSCARKTTTVTTSTSTQTTTKTTTSTSTMSTTVSTTVPVTTAAGTQASGSADGTTTPETTTTTTLADEDTAYIFAGSMGLTVADPEAFANDPDVHSALQQNIANLSGVPAQYITVHIKVVSGANGARRLHNGNGSGQVAAAAFLDRRRLQAGNVVVDFDIRIPKADTVLASTDTMDKITASVTGTAAQAALTTLISRDPTLSTKGVTVETFTASVAVPITAAPVATAGAGEETGSNPAGIIVGVLFAIIVLAAVGAYAWWWRQRKMQDPQRMRLQEGAIKAAKTDGQTWVVGDPAMVRNTVEEEWQNGVVTALEPVVLVRLRPTAQDRGTDAEQPGTEWAFVQRPKISMYGPKVPSPGNGDKLEQIHVRISEKPASPDVAGEFKTEGADVKYLQGEVVYVRAHTCDKWKQALVADEEQQLMRLAASPSNSMPTKWPMITRITPPEDQIEMPRAKTSKASKMSGLDTAGKQVGDVAEEVAAAEVGADGPVAPESTTDGGGGAKLKKQATKGDVARAPSQKSNKSTTKSSQKGTSGKASVAKKVPAKAPES